MGLLSKIFGDNKETEKLAKDVLNGLFDNALQRQETAGSMATPDVSASEPSSVKRNTPSGFSWGEDMPDEENQFNYNGSFIQYFENIFNTEFSSYRFERENFNGMKRIVYTFMDGSRKALVVELMPSASASKKLRENCASEGIPYLRYYYDHHGWWNTRSYVVERTRKALGGEK